MHVCSTNLALEVHGDAIAKWELRKYADKSQMKR